jgi:transposase InsO family protein
LKLAQYEFEIIHKPGKKHVNADVLSRHIAILHSFPEKTETTDQLDLTHDIILREQRADEYCQKQLEEVRNGTDVDFSIDNEGILHFGKESHNRRIVIPRTLVHTVIEYHHDKVYAGHQGITRTQDLIKLKYFWPTLNKDVENYINNCHSCAQHKGGRIIPVPLGELPETHFPFEMTSIDICGPYPISKKGNRYLLTFIDHFTRFPEAVPIPKQDAETVARALLVNVFSRHGCPQVLSSDRGTNFMSELFQEMCKIFQIKRLTSSAFNPKMQGKIEKLHFGLNQSFSHYVNKYGNDWDEFVDYALMAHRAVPHSITKYSPYYLLYGREMRLPSVDDLTVLNSRAHMKDSPITESQILEHLNTLSDRLQEAYKVVIENNRLSRTKQKEYYDQGTKLRQFQVRDMVYIGNGYRERLKFKI